MRGQEEARRVRAARAYAGFSRTQLAAAAGLSPPLLARIERGERAPTPEELHTIARSCSVPAAFFTEEALPPPVRERAPNTAVVARLRELREKVDRFLDPPAPKIEVGPLRDESAELLDAIDPSFDGLDPRLMKAIEHPLRMRILVFATETARTLEELSEELRVPVDEVVEQLGVLVRVGAVQRVIRDGDPAYQAVVRDIFDDRQWSYFPIAYRRCRVAFILDLLQADVRAAMPSGGFDRETVHVSRSPLRLDERGYEEVVALLKDVVVRVLQINAEADARRTYGESEAEIETELAILHFHRDPGARPASIPAGERA